MLKSETMPDVPIVEESWFTFWGRDDSTKQNNNDFHLVWIPRWYGRDTSLLNTPIDEVNHTDVNIYHLRRRYIDMNKCNLHKNEMLVNGCL